MDSPYPRSVAQLRFDRRAFRQTTPRQEVLRVFVEHPEPLTVADVHSRLRDRRINLASVYRAIHLFQQLGLLIAADHVAGGQRFELSDDHRAHHHHLICERCGQVTDFEECEIATLERKIHAQTKFQVHRHELQFYGLCHRCTG
jgi:Fur family ferric uptake transcriptional regulator